MARIVASPEFSNFLDFKRLEDFFVGKSPEHEELMAGFSELVDHGTITPVSLSSTKFVFEGSQYGMDYRITVSGSGIGPVSSLAQLEAAFEAGLATGQFNSIVIHGSKTPAYIGDTFYPETNFLNFTLRNGGYSLTDGDVRINVQGDLPSTMSEFFDVSTLAEQLAQYDTLTAAQKTALIADLNDYDFDSLSLKVGGEVVFKLSTSPTKISLELLGYELNLIGTFPDEVGDSLKALMDLVEALDNGASIDLGNFQGFGVDRITMTNPEGEVILKSFGDLGSGGSASITRVIMNGETAKNLVVGYETDNFVSSFLGGDGSYIVGDELFGTDKADQFFGLGGNDRLTGGNGADILFGGSGNDRIDGGRGADIINPGSNLSSDTIIGSRGNDTIIFSDNGPHGYQYLTYADLIRGISVNVNGQKNTGVIKKGGVGTDTLIDVKVPMENAALSFTSGLSIVGSQLNDRFRFVTADNAWASIQGGEGTDSYNVTITKGSILRIDFFGDQGVNLNVSTGVITNDGFGNTETLTVRNNSGQLSIQGSDFADRLIGSDDDERFILRQGNDYVDGMGGNDMVRYDRGGVTAVHVNLDTGIATGNWSGVAFTDTLVNIENIRGSRNDDDVLIGNGADNRIQGRGGDDTILGNAGRDRLEGEAGDDNLNGGQGNDILIGGIGDDRLRGAAGRDQFWFDASLNEGTDTIVDFQDGRDLLRIEGAEFNDLILSTQVVGGDNVAIVQIGSGTVIRLEDMSHTDLDATDFIFV